MWVWTVWAQIDYVYGQVAWKSFSQDDFQATWLVTIDLGMKQQVSQINNCVHVYSFLVWYSRHFQSSISDRDIMKLWQPSQSNKEIHDDNMTAKYQGPAHFIS